jgi:predicted Zn finger-like uncharacterized protein
MYTQCPHCETFFRVSTADLEVADGEVRCSRCDAVFDARATLHAEHADPALGDAELAVEVHADPAIGDLFGHPPTLAALPAQDLPEGSPDTLTAALDAAADAAPALEAPAPLAVPPAPPELPAAGRPRPRRLPWAAASALLAVALGAQLVHAERGALARDPAVGPALVEAYQRLGLPIVEPTDLAALAVTRAEVTSHPLYDSVLFITASVTNEARFAQPLPLLRVRLDDRWGEPVGVRMFTPQEYLRTPQPDGRARPGRSYAVALEVVDPGNEAVGYALVPCLPAGGSIVCLGDDPR